MKTVSMCELLLCSFSSFTSIGPEFWDEIDKDIDADVGDLFPSVAPQEILPLTPEHSEKRAIVTWIVFLLLYFQTKFSLTDQALAWLLKFLCSLLNVLGMFSNKLQDISSELPQSVYSLTNCVFSDTVDLFKKRAVCKRCHSIYRFQDCVERTGSINAHTVLCGQNHHLHVVNH